MEVHELIKVLKDMPQDAEVTIPCHWDGGGDSFSNVKLYDAISNLYCGCYEADFNLIVSDYAQERHARHDKVKIVHLS